MRIAMILRPDADRVFGGDTVVMRKLSAAMCEQGPGVPGVGAQSVGALRAHVTVGMLHEMPPADEFDLLHIFALAPVDHALAMVAWARRGGAAIVFSPLYYNDFRDWFERAALAAPRWRALVRRFGKPRVWRFYRAWQTARLPYQSSWRQMRRALLAADVIATTSRWENRWIATHFRLPEAVSAAMRLSPLGIDAGLYGRTFGDAELADFRRQYSLPECYVAQVARLEEKKNQLAVIEALYDDPIPLVFVGRDSPYYAPGYGDRCRTLGAQRGNVYFIDWLPEADLPRLYANAAAHILPSWVEQPGLSSLEAGASGTRVISTAVCGLPELMGNNAWYCDPYDRASIRASVRAALASPPPVGLRSALLTHFSWAQVAAENLTLYAHVLHQRR